MSTFGSRLRDARRAVKLTQAVVAKRVGMPQSLLSELESDEHSTSGYTPRLAHIYKVTARWLADGEGPRDVSDAEALEDPQVLALWTLYSQTDAATRDVINCLLGQPAAGWMSAALTAAIDSIQQLAREQTQQRP